MRHNSCTWENIIVDDFELAKTFNNHYSNSVKINSGFKPLKITNQSKDYLLVIDEIIRTYQDHLQCEADKECNYKIKYS